MTAKRVVAGPTDGDAGGVLVLVALFLPAFILVAGMVLDLGFAFTVREAAQAACDLGALAGVQELDWDSLARGVVVLNRDRARDQTLAACRDNLLPLVAKGLVSEPRISVTVTDRAAGYGEGGEPAVAVEVSLTVRTFFTRRLPGLSSGIPIKVRAEARCVQRTRW